MGAALPAMAQTSLTTANINFQFREPVPPTGDQSVARASILADAEKDCAIAAKAFGMQCEVNGVQFNMNGMGMNFGNQVPGAFVFGNVNAVLTHPPVVPQN
jgi:hypothetical protein